MSMYRPLSQEERAVIENEANERAVMERIRDGDEIGLRHLLEDRRVGHFLGIEGSLIGYETPLMACVYGRMSERGNDTVMRVMQLLLDHGADINQVFWGKTVLGCAMFWNNVEIIEFLISHSANVNTVYDAKLNRTLLFSCSTPRVVESLIRNGANVNTRDNERWSPLHYIATKSRSGNADDVARSFITKGALLEARTLTGATPLHLASTFGSSLVAIVLLQSGADVNAIFFQDGSTSLHIAARFGYKHIVRLLLSRGASMTALDRDGRTPWHACIAAHPVEMRETLDVLKAEATRRARYEAVAMGLEQPDSILHKFPNELFRTLQQYGIEHDGHGSESREGSESEGESDTESDSESEGDHENHTN